MNDTTTIAVERTGRTPIARIGLVGAAAAALVAVGILAFGATATPNGTLAAGTGTGAGTSTIAGDLPVFDGRGFDGPGRGFDGPGRGFGGITITAISGSNISLETKDGWTRTITVDSGTAYTKSGTTIALSDLKVGDEIRFRQTLESDGTWTIDAIAVIPPHVGGKVTAISGSTITVEQRDGTSATIRVTAETTYRVAGTDGAALSDVTVGMFLAAEGTKSSDGSLTATAVHAVDPATMPGPGEHGLRGPGGRGPWGGDFRPDATSTPDATSGSAG